MNEFNSIERHKNLNEISLIDQTKVRVDKINKLKDYFNSEIQKRKTTSKKLSK